MLFVQAGAGIRGPNEITRAVRVCTDALARCTCAQIVVQGIPWSYTWKELKDIFAEYGDVERADVVTGNDGRSRVGADGVGCVWVGGAGNGAAGVGAEGLSRSNDMSSRVGTDGAGRGGYATPRVHAMDTCRLVIRPTFTVYAHPYNPPTRDTQGFGTVRFSSTEAAQAAIAAWNEQELEDRKLAVFFDKYA